MNDKIPCPVESMGAVYPDQVACLHLALTCHHSALEIPREGGWWNFLPRTLHLEMLDALLRVESVVLVRVSEVDDESQIEFILFLVETSKLTD